MEQSLSHKEEVHGLTTAAGIWLTAAVGVTAGLGRELSAIFGTALALGILSALVQVERWLHKRPGHYD